MGKTKSIENVTKIKNMKVSFVLPLILAFFASCLFLSCNNGSEKIVYIPVPVPNNGGSVTPAGGGSVTPAGGETATPAGGETQSGIVTSVTESSIVEEIKKMTEPGTVKASGVFDSKLIEDVKNAINYLTDERPNVLVTLDLSAVKGLSKFSFANCKNLAGIVLPNDKTNMTSIGDEAFKGCSRLTSVTIPSNVTSIGKSAFEGCIGLASVTIPGSVTSIGDSAFYGCKGFTSVTIPGSVTSIGDSAFYGCSGITSVTIPDSVTSIGDSAFYVCPGLTSCNYTGTLEQWCKISFSDYYSNPCFYAKNFCIQGQEIKDLVIPDSVTSIGSYAFYNYSGLASVTIEERGSNLPCGLGAFDRCKNLSVNYTGTLAQWCNISAGIPNVKFCIQGQEIKDLVIPDGVTSIGSSAFYGCAGLTSVTIPSGVTSIGDKAFYGCAGIASVTIPSGVTSIGSSAFYGCTGLTSVTIPSGVTSIGNRAFEECTGLASVTIPGSVTSIGDSAFYKCSGLTSVTIPNSVTSIGVYAFSRCTGLENAVFSDTSGWYYPTNGGLTENTIDSTKLADPITAALYLRDKYSKYNWYKKI